MPELAEIIFRDRREIKGIEIEARVYSVPETEDYPEGIKYSFQAHREGDTVLRYDNYNEHSDSRHHKHIGEKETESLENQPEDREEIVNLYRRFLEEVEQNAE